MSWRRFLRRGWWDDERTRELDSYLDLDSGVRHLGRRGDLADRRFDFAQPVRGRGADVDLEIAADCLGGPLFYRHVVSGMPIDDAYVRELVDTFIRAYGC